jgi:hypothetical protein
MEVEAMCRIVITAIALKRYQLKDGHYPAALSDLTPEFLASAPPDPVDGQQLRYRLMPNGSFLLYSIGLNGKDDGGNASSPGKWGDNRVRWIYPSALDWVWPQPATATEIQYFYEHPPGP